MNDNFFYIFTSKPREVIKFAKGGNLVAKLVTVLPSMNLWYFPFRKKCLTVQSTRKFTVLWGLQVSF